MSHAFTRLDGVATIFGLGGSDFGCMHELTHVQFSAEGMVAIACEPLRMGMRVAMGFQAREALACSGVVERCDSRSITGDEGYRVVVRFDTNAAV